MTFGSHIRARRESLRYDDSTFSVRQVAQRVGVEPAYLSKVERDQVAPPSETTILRLAAELGEDADVMLALAGKVSDELRRATAAASATSSGQPRTECPAAAIFAQSACNRASAMSSAATLAPSSANSSAVAAPMPLAAPVTTATLPRMDRLNLDVLVAIGMCVWWAVWGSNPGPTG